MIASLRLTLGAIEVELSEVGEAIGGALERRFAPFASLAGSAGGAAIRLERVADEAFIPVPARAEPNRVRIACDGRRVGYTGHRVDGWFDVAGRGGVLRLARGRYEPVERAIENYVRAVVAWRAVALGGALVHAASAVWRERGYLFFGPSGAGKSTLSASNRRARIVSDDLSLVLPGPGGTLELVGSPFRGTYRDGAPVAGRFALAAAFRLVQASVAEVRPVSRVRAFGELVANLPFVAETFPGLPDRFGAVEAAFRAVPLRHLAFRKDDDFWDAIEAAGLAPAAGR